MEKSFTFVILGSIAVGYASTTLSFTEKIKQADCPTLKLEFANKSNISTALVLIGGLAFIGAGLFANFKG